MGISKASANAVTPATKGALAVGSGTNTASILSVGSNGETLVADSSTTTGLRYNPQPVLSNPFINGGFDFFQRSGTPTTGITVTGGFAMTVDRWWGRTATGGGSMIVSQQSAQDANLPSIRYCARSRRATSNSDTGALQLWTFFETSNSIPFSGRAVTVSFYARKSAGFTGTFDASLFSGTGTDQNELTGTYTGRTTVANATHTLTTSWQRFVITGTIASTATELGFIFSHNPTGTAGSDDYYEVTGVQLDIGTYTASSAPAFRRAGGNIAGELAACQRYYYLHASGLDKTICNGFYISASQVRGSLGFPVTMRIAPTMVVATGTNWYGADAVGGVDTFNSFTIFQATQTATQIYNNSEVAGTAGQGVSLVTANASASLAFNAEL